MKYAMNSRLIVEDVDGEILVCDPESATVHRLKGIAADVVRSVRTSSVPVELTPNSSLEALKAAGILMTAEDDEIATARFGRRHAMKAGAAVTAIGLVTVALPEAARAASVNNNNNNEPQPPAAVIDSNPFAGADSNGAMSISWSDPDVGSFTYNWTLTVLTGSGSGATSGGPVTSGQQIAIGYTLNNESVARVTFTSNTQTAVTKTATASRFDPPN